MFSFSREGDLYNYDKRVLGKPILNANPSICDKSVFFFFGEEYKSVNYIYNFGLVKYSTQAIRPISCNQNVLVLFVLNFDT